MSETSPLTTREETLVHEAHATAESGHISTADGLVSGPLASALKPAGRAITPEALLAAGFAACLHHAAAEAVAAKGTTHRSVRVETAVALTKDGGRGYAIDVHAAVSTAGAGQEHWETIVHHANEIWPFGHETGPRFRVEVVPESPRD